MATKQEYAQLSLFVYNLSASANPANRPNLPSENWSRLEYFSDDYFGFSYGIFRNAQSGEVVVSYTGTNEGKLADFLVANIPAGLGLGSPQARTALRKAERVRSHRIFIGSTSHSSYPLTN